MKRTRKWAFVAQEASRLAELGLTPLEIANRLDVKRSTVQRWMSAGKLRDTRRGATKSGGGPKVAKIAKPSEWSAAVRKDFALDATDDQLVTLAESALGMSLDPMQPATVRVSAMGRYAALVKQLALVARAADVPEAAPKPQAVNMRPHVVRRSSVDPRKVLTAVK